MACTKGEISSMGKALTAFVTGGAGFLGLNLVEQLVRAGWRVVALHRAQSKLTYLQRCAVELVEGAANAMEVRDASSGNTDEVLRERFLSHYTDRKLSMQDVADLL